ncbi:uncharacterized protein LOC125193821 isoform X1 [Salvia hispanica]|uniref:uncharacterized protein LOC125193821 isoform X1 n=2 Tax=Salvia hispanica TaxID=49212 RepID=UPI002009A508|nr:uncharacterized protein LOC125193821 isoform X1 [Salvia hispanica]
MLTTIDSTQAPYLCRTLCSRVSISSTEFADMPENSVNPAAFGDNTKSGPDFFGLYKGEIDALLSQDDNLLPHLPPVSQLSRDVKRVVREKGSMKKSCQTEGNNTTTGSAPLFSNGIGALLSDFKRERLQLLINQSASTLPQEIDEMENPVLSVCRIRSCLSHKEKLLSLEASTHTTDQRQHPKKKAKVIPPCADLESGQIQLDDDLRFILEQDSSKVKELMESYTTEISTTLQHMETKLEEILNSVMTTCRVMTLAEKQELRTRIQKLPATSLDRVVEILEQDNPSQKYLGSILNVDLSVLGNVTLWRLYFYVATVEAASLQVLQ